ncbi:MAG: hypothetical protein ABIQ40_02485 [Bacteroidia bacterium]
MKKIFVLFLILFSTKLFCQITTIRTSTWNTIGYSDNTIRKSEADADPKNGYVIVIDERPGYNTIQVKHWGVTQTYNIIKKQIVPVNVLTGNKSGTLYTLKPNSNEFGWGVISFEVTDTDVYEIYKDNFETRTNYTKISILKS